MQTKVFLVICQCLILNSCCLTIKEEHLGNNLYLSEYDNIDRRIIYSKEKCSGSGVEIVPMTVTEFNHDSHWIIAKSMSVRTNSKIQYWIINKDLKDTVNTKMIKSHRIGPIDSLMFETKLKANNIDLELKIID